jgi:hypothetical protein
MLRGQFLRIRAESGLRDDVADRVSVTRPDIVIAGGGIGGLTLALALHDVGIPCRVYEAAGELGELGVGINILPHAAREYERLGVIDALTASGVELERYIWFNRFGQEIFSEARGRAAGYEWPQVSIHRGRFHQILIAAVRERLGPDAIRLDHHLAEFTETDERIQAQFIAKNTGAVQANVSGDLLVAADGIHSIVRRHFYPDQGAPRWAGNMMWRMTVELDAPVLGGATMFSAGTDTKGYGSLTSQHLKSATRTKLESLGYTYDETNPQLRINFGGQMSDKLRVSSAPVGPVVGVGYYGYRAGMYGAWGGYNQTTVSQYTEGTLNLDVVDVAANRMVWESVANGRVTEDDLKNIGPVLTEVVGEMLSKFPPHAAQ